MVEETTWAIAIATVAVGLGALLYARIRCSPGTKDPAGVSSSSYFNSNERHSHARAAPPSSLNHEPVDVWEERRRRGIAAASSHGSKGSTGQKPFSSSYYYAHNNSKATGGYKDGLTMEDFTMNGPRLLSRGGKAANTSDGLVDRAPETNDEFSNGIVHVQKAPNTKPRRTLPISKYLWDDPGESSGVASIRIERLPGAASNLPELDWETARSSVARIDTRLQNGGMTVSVETTLDMDYSLTVPRFYGDVEAVEHISKAKRLIVRIKKKRGMFSRSNTKTWPHPHKKVE